jgi:hypothetical protein
MKNYWLKNEEIKKSDCENWTALCETIKGKYKFFYVTVVAHVIPSHINDFAPELFENFKKD